MRLFTGIVSGFALIFLSQTLFGSSAFLAAAVVYAFALYLLFFTATNLSVGTLIGAALGSELLGGAHLGRGGLLAVFVYATFYLFKEQLRLTSLFVRFALSLAITLAWYDFWLYPFAGYLTRLWPLVWIYPPLCLVSYLFYSFRRPHAHEFV